MGVNEEFSSREGGGEGGDGGRGGCKRQVCACGDPILNNVDSAIQPTCSLFTSTDVRDCSSAFLPGNGKTPRNCDDTPIFFKVWIFHCYFSIIIFF
jgi:hypothetical protein